MPTLVCFGDSLTEGADIPVGHTWPALVANGLHIDVINGGIGGDTTQGMLARFNAEVVTKRPAFVFVMGGTNDLWWDWEINTILGNLFSIVVQARHHAIATIIGLPLPVNVAAARTNDLSPPLGGYERLAKKMEKLVEALTRHAMQSEVAVVDLYHPFIKNQRQIRADLFLPDGLHPNKAGHLTIAKAVTMTFRKEFAFS